MFNFIKKMFTKQKAEISDAPVVEDIFGESLPESENSGTPEVEDKVSKVIKEIVVSAFNAGADFGRDYARKNSLEKHNRYFRFFVFAYAICVLLVVFTKVLTTRTVIVQDNYSIPQDAVLYFPNKATENHYTDCMQDVAEDVDFETARAFCKHSADIFFERGLSGAEEQ